MTEKELSEKLGLSRESIKDIRDKYQEGVDYIKIESKRPKHLWSIDWTETGYNKLMQEMGFKAEESQVVKDEQVFSSTGKVTAKYANKRLIQCQIEGTLYTVLVRDSDYFVLGMDVPLRRDGQRLVAARHPRRPGKW